MISLTDVKKKPKTGTTVPGTYQFCFGYLPYLCPGIQNQHGLGFGAFPYMENWYRFRGTGFGEWSQLQLDNTYNDERNETVLFRASSIWKNESDDGRRQNLLQYERLAACFRQDT